MFPTERSASLVPFATRELGSDPGPLPDIAQDAVATVGGSLDWVGMAGIEVALRLRTTTGELVITPARATAWISLDDPNAKGIHMSRLFLALQRELDRCDLSLDLIDQLLLDFVVSHRSLTQASYLSFQFEHMAKRSSLLSNHSTWRSYPVRIEGRRRGEQVQHHVHVSVTYSSTCPCSAALARQLLQRQFQEECGEHRWLSVSQVMHWLGSQGSLATPHSQRSLADVTVQLHEQSRELGIVRLIDLIETAVATPVQAAVKRRDEQEFARLNGENLMFCEDSARRIRAVLDADPEFVDYRIQASHLESLHPHDAVAIVTKGVPGGLQP